MDRIIYEALKKRVSVVPFSELDDESRANMILREDSIVYFFNATGLLDKDGDDLPSIMHPMRTKNMWNVCQRFYWLIKDFSDLAGL